MSTRATDITSAVNLFVPDTNRIHDIINGDATTEVAVENGFIPSIRKVYADTLYFLNEVEPWVQGQEAVTTQQLYNFGGILYWAPSATASNTVTLGATPVGDTNWQVAPTRWNYLQAVAITYNTITDNVALLQTGVIDTVNGVNYFYDADNEVVYFSAQSITGTIQSISSPVNSVVTLTMSDSNTYEILADNKDPVLRSVAIANDTTVDNVAFLQTGVSLTANILRDSANERTLVAWDTLTTPYVISSYAANDYAGYDVVTDQGTFEFVTRDIHDKRTGYGWPETNACSLLTGWGFVTGIVDSSQATTNQLALTKAIENSTVLNFDGDDCHINLNGRLGLVAKSNITINGNNSMLHIDNNSDEDKYQIVDISGVENVVINDLRVTGDVRDDDQENRTFIAEQGFGFAILSSKNITLNRCYATRCLGDGFYCGLENSATDINRNVVLNQCEAVDCRRLGLTYISGEVTYNDCIARDIGLTAYTTLAGGFDCEPNSSQIAWVDLTVNNLKTKNCRGVGLSLSLQNTRTATLLAGYDYAKCCININGYTSEGDGLQSDSEDIIPTAIYFNGIASANSLTNKIKGSITLSKINIISPKYNPLTFINFGDVVDATIKELSITDVGDEYSANDTLDETMSLFNLHYGSNPTSQTSYQYNKINIEGFYYTDTRGDLFSSTATTTNHRVNKIVSWSGGNPDSLQTSVPLDTFLIRDFDTNITPNGLVISDYTTGFRFDGKLPIIDLDGDTVLTRIPSGLILNCVANGADQVIGLPDANQVMIGQELNFTRYGDDSNALTFTTTVIDDTLITKDGELAGMNGSFYELSDTYPSGDYRFKVVRGNRWRRLL